MDKITPLKVDLKPIEINMTTLDVTIEPINIDCPDLIPDVTLDTVDVEINPINMGGLTGDKKHR